MQSKLRLRISTIISGIAFILAFSSSSALAEMYCDKDGNCSISIKGGAATGGSRADQKDESDYYLNERPAQNTFGNAIAYVCQPESALKGYARDQLDNLYNSAGALISDIRGSAIAIEQKSRLEQQVRGCQLNISKERLNRPFIPSYRPPPSQSVAAAPRSQYRIDAEAKSAGDAVQVSGRVYGPMCKKLRLDIFGRSKEGGIFHATTVIKNVDQGGRLFNCADRIFRVGESGWIITSVYPNCVEQ